MDDRKKQLPPGYRHMPFIARHPIIAASLYMLAGAGIACLLLSSEPQWPSQGDVKTAAAKLVAFAKGKQEVNKFLGITDNAQPKQQEGQPAKAASPASTAEPVKAPPSICKDTCFKAKDGVCDDGSKQDGGEHGLVLCDLGTDCSDCGGAWEGVAHTTSWQEKVGPIEFLRQKKIEVRVKRTAPAVQPSLLFAFTNPEHDVDVSGAYHFTGVVEAGISHIFYRILKEPCSDPSNPGLLADVGANFGWYSVFSAKLGCRVVAWEPVPQFRAFFEYNVAVNKMQDQIIIRNAVVAEQPGKTYKVVVPQRGIWGTAGIDGANIDKAIDNKGDYENLEIVAEGLDQILGDAPRVNLLKADVEGYEPGVIDSAKGLLAAGKIDNIVMEYSPTAFEKTHNWQGQLKLPHMLVALHKAKFTIGHITERTGLAPQDWDKSPNTLPEVTPENLKYDILDFQQMASPNGFTFFRKPCAEMDAMRIQGHGIPERFHPKSFRASFGFNTNIWATKEERLRKLLQGPPVGIFPLDQPLNKTWFLPYEQDFTVGGRSCSYLRDQAKREKWDEGYTGEVVVSHHCRCAPDHPCKAAEAAADKCAKEGRTVFADLM